ncbi:MAG: D-alanine--D-alanine ligase [candidate division Zixibacteria bacterium]|nr:D-alanine--D-alanine ligase [candidate division Zixibacteria bacterium]
MKVLLLAGGDSGEREVSLDSGAAIYESLKRLGHTVYAIDPASGKSLLTSDGKFLTGPSTAGATAAAPVQRGAMALAKTLVTPAFDDVKVVFLALHGGTGENGSIQNLLELAGMPFTGSDMTGSTVAMHKEMSKRLFKSEGINTPKWKTFRVKDNGISRDIVNEISSFFEFPVIVKPNDSGSTLGLTRVEKREELAEAFQKTLKESKIVLVEEYISGRELTVPILDNRVFPVIEIKPESGLYDYEAKYTKGRSQYIVPAEISNKLSDKIKSTAKQVYDILGAAGLARIDFILAKGNKYHCLELNTLPGMTELSLAPMAAQAEGVSFDQLIELLIKSALEHHRK